MFSQLSHSVLLKTLFGHSCFNHSLTKITRSSIFYNSKIGIIIVFDYIILSSICNLHHAPRFSPVNIVWQVSGALDSQLISKLDRVVVFNHVRCTFPAIFNIVIIFIIIIITIIIIIIIIVNIITITFIIVNKLGVGISSMIHSCQSLLTKFHQSWSKIRNEIQKQPYPIGKGCFYQLTATFPH